MASPNNWRRSMPYGNCRSVSKVWYVNPFKDLGSLCMLIGNIGSIVRVGPHQLLTDDPEVLRKMSGVRSPYRRSSFYDGMRLEPGVDHVLSERDENRHNELRAKMGAGVSFFNFLLRYFSQDKLIRI